MAAKLTALILTRNEEQDLPGCLDSVGWADEIFVVDSGSGDRTVEIARARGARVEHHPYEGQAQQSNWAIGRAANEWILLVDADERVSGELTAEIQALLAQGPDCDGYVIYRRTLILGREVRYGGYQRDKVTRLFRRDKGRYPERRVHVDTVVDGRVGVLKGRLLHHSCHDMNDLFDKSQHWAASAALDLADAGRQGGPIQMLVRPLFTFLRVYVFYLGFLDGTVGLILSLNASFYVFSKYARLWGMQQARTS